MSSRRVYFPFSAIVGMDNAKLALLVIAVDPTISGVLLSGDKGTGKSTLVRALANVLPEIPVVKGCPFNCNPFNPLEMCDYHYELWSRGEKLEVEYRKMRVIDLPLNITPDRLVGSIDVERTLREGRVVFKPGLLAEANRNILYIDEVNLLEDYIADLLLDAAASGWNIVEREGISFRHPARFILVGSMNPEEGELRPQLLDRFGLYVDVSASSNTEERIEIVRRVEEFHRDPISFMRKYEESEREVREKVKRARELLPEVELDDDLLKLIVDTVIKLGIKTHRAEIVTAKTAKAIAALNGRRRVTLDDVKKAMELALPHRMRLSPFEPPSRKLEEVMRQVFGEKPENPPPSPRENFRESSIKREPSKETGIASPSESSSRDSGGTGSMGGSDNVLGRSLPESTRQEHLPLSPPRSGESLAGGSFTCTSRTRTGVAIAAQRGAIVDSIPPPRSGDIVDVDLYASIRQAILRSPRVPVVITQDDIRVRVRRPERPHLHILVLDASGSMYARTKLKLASSLVNSIIRRSYVEKTLVSLIVSRGREARVLLGPTRSYSKLLETVHNVEIGGSTPLSDGLCKAFHVAKRFLEKYRNGIVTVYVITDGKANVFLRGSMDDDLKFLQELYQRANVKLKLLLVKTRHGLDITSVRDKLRSWVSMLRGEVHTYYVD